MKRKNILYLILLLWGIPAFAQDDIPVDNSMNDSTENIIDKPFPAIQIFNHPTTNVLPRGEMKLYFGHRMGELSTGTEGLFGLYTANSRFGADLGLFKNITIGIGSTSQSHLFDGYVKWLIIKQGQMKMPFSIGIFTNATIATGDMGYPSDAKVETWQRLSYTTELMFSRKFSEHFSGQLMTAYVHKNMVPSVNDKNDIFAAGLAVDYKLTNVWHIAVEYAYLPQNQIVSSEVSKHQLSVGVQIHSGPRHVFQLFFSTSPGINENTVLTETTSGKGFGFKHFRFCFNLPTTFKIF